MTTNTPATLAPTARAKVSEELSISPSVDSPSFVSGLLPSVLVLLLVVATVSGSVELSLVVVGASVLPSVLGILSVSESVELSLAVVAIVAPLQLSEAES